MPQTLLPAGINVWKRLIASTFKSTPFLSFKCIEHVTGILQLWESLLPLSFFSPSSGVLSNASAAVLLYVPAAVEAAAAVVLVETAVRSIKTIILGCLPPHTVAINPPRPQWPMDHHHPNSLLLTSPAGKSTKTVFPICPVGTLL